MEEILQYVRESRLKSDERYNTLINIILNNVTRCVIAGGVQIRNDTAILEYIKAVEPEKYEKTVSELYKKNEIEQHIPTIE